MFKEIRAFGRTSTNKTNMKILRVIILFLSIVSNSYSQTKNDSIFIGSSSQSCGSDVGTAHYPGGLDGLKIFFNSNFNVPDSLITAPINATIFLKITVDTTGILTTSVLKGINQSIDNETLRVFSIMPDWIPGIREGKKISETFVLPIRIELGKTDEK
jgi:hypothetical protein